MDRVVEIYTLAPDGVPHPTGQLTVQSDQLDDLSKQARRALEAQGHRVRCVSFTPAGLVAYVESPR